MSVPESPMVSSTGDEHWPARPSALCLRRDGLLALLLVVLPLWALYLLTAPRTVVLEDDGLFILSAWFSGVEHPPGFPLYVLLGKLATLWPFGTPAWRVHALSGLYGALACGVLWLMARMLLPAGLPAARPAAYLAALGLGVSGVFWSQAIIADVYSLHALLLFALLLVSLAAHRRAAAGQDLGWLPAAAALLTGLGLANHWPLLLLSAPGVALLWWPALGGLWRRLPVLLVWLVLGLLPYAWMVWRSHMGPAISFQGSIDSVAELLDFLLRRGYAGVDNSAATGWDDKLLFFAFLLRQAAAQLLLPGALLALAGFAVQWRRWGLGVAAALTLAFLGPTLVLVGLLDFAYEPVQREAFRVYATAAWGIFALWAGLGLVELATRWPWLRRGGVAAAAVALLLVLSLAVHGLRNHRAGDWLAREYAATILSSLEADSVLLAAGDLHLPPLAYVQRLEGLRPDVELVSADGLLLEPRLFDPYRTPKPQQQAVLAAFIAAAERPVYGVARGNRAAGLVSWLTYRAVPGAGAAAPTRFALTAGERALLARLLDAGALRDGWSELLRRLLLERFAAFQAAAELAGQWPTDDDALAALATRVLDLPEAALMRAAVLSERAPEQSAAEIRQRLAQFADGVGGRWIGARHLAKYYNVLARTAQLDGRPELARAALARYWEVRPDGPNPVGAPGAVER
jgi:hypothetical protein